MQRTHSFFPFLFLAALVFLQTSCGYSRKTVLTHEIQRVHVDTFKNKIPLEEIYAYEPGLEMKITNAIIRRFEQDGNLRVANREKSDVVLEGDLVGFTQEGMRFTGLERIEEYRLFVVVNLRLRDTKTNEIIWEEPGFSGDTSYFLTGPRSVSRTIAAERAVDRLARNVVDRVVEDW